MNILTPRDLKVLKYSGVIIIYVLNYLNDTAQSTYTESSRSVSTTPRTVTTTPQTTATTEITMTPRTTTITTTISSNLISPSIIPVVEQDRGNILLRRMNLKQALGDTVFISATRENLIDEAIKIYMEKPFLICKKLHVTFVGEEGLDLDGVSREFFSLFWKHFLYQYFRNSLPMMKPSLFAIDKEFVAAGRILVHGYILLGYLPININPCYLYFILTGNTPATKHVAVSFLNALLVSDQRLIDDAIRLHSFSESLNARLTALLGTMDLDTLPQPHNLREILKRLSWYQTHN